MGRRPEPGPTLPSVPAAAADRVGDAEVDVRDAGVDREQRRADDEDPDVEHDEGEDGAERSLLDRLAVEPDRHHELGWMVWRSSRRRIRPTSRWRTTLTEPSVEPAEAPTNIRPIIAITPSAGQLA